MIPRYAIIPRSPLLTATLRTQYPTYPRQNSRNSAATHSATEKPTSDGRNPTAEDAAGYTVCAYHSAASGFACANAVAARATIPKGMNSMRLSRYFLMFLRKSAQHGRPHCTPRGHKPVDALTAVR